MAEFLEKLFSLAGKTVLVTGASRGIGHALAGACAAAGGQVYAMARSRSTPAFAGGSVSYKSCDITDGKKLADLCEQMANSHGSIDVLVNCVGVSLGPDPDGQMNAFEETVAVNLTASYRLMLAVYPHMRTKGGSIINLSSLASRFGMPQNPGYVASKGGLAMLCKGLAVDWGPEGIRVNTIVPGYILTDMTQKSFDDPALRAERQARMILDRWGTPADLVGAVIFLASDASSYVTGADIVVDGG
ncbi:MAG: SDR family oxidoreductase, partial [Thermodesulfovibrionales bacterium]|nr:SDR family oxidoreductase [Thermodesulfovibrionales bacterium]